MRYTYAWPFRSYESAMLRLADLVAEGDVSHGEDPRIESYRATQLDTGRAVTRFKITLESGQ